MRWIGWMREAYQALFRKERTERELDEELNFHLEQEIRKNLRAGMNPEEARRQAHRSFGGVERVKEEVRDERGTRLLEDLLRDLRYAGRTLIRNPAYATAIVLTLGLGIGANTAVFSLVSGVLLDPLPYGDDDELVYFRQSLDAGEIRFSVHDITDLRSGLQSVEDLAEYHHMTFTLRGHGEPELVETGVVSPHFLDLMGMEPILGRAFTAADDALGAEPVLVLSHGYWQSRFGSDPSVVGRAFEMNGKLHTVIGVLPPIPQYPDVNDVYMPTSACPIRSSEGFRENRSARMMALFGRLRDDVALERAHDDVRAVASRLRERHPEAYAAERGHRVGVAPLKEELVRDARPTLLLLLGTAGCVLLIACANVANLALARLTRREQELTVRTALGAGRGRLARQLLTESVLLGVLGGVLGVGIALAGVDLLSDFAARFTPRAREVGVDLPVLVFAAGSAVLTGLLFGALPALQVRDASAGTLRAGVGLSPGARKGRIQSGLVVTQLAATFVLLVGVGLLLRSFVNVQQVDAGYDPTNVLAMQVTVNARNSEMTDEERKRFYLSVLERLEARRGVVSAAVTNSVPMRGTGFGTVAVKAVDNPGPDDEPRAQAEYRVASTGFFRTTGIRLERGRFFDEADSEDALPVAVINVSLARRLWPGEDPLGRPLIGCSNNTGQCFEPALRVVGVMADVRQHGLDRPPPDQVYVPAAQASFPGIFFLVRTVGDPLARAGELEAVVHETDPTIPVSGITTLEELWGRALAPRRLTLTLLALFGAVALAVSLAGIAGVLAFSVSQRTREIGVRIALGAERGGVLALVLRRGMALVALGLALGGVGALLLSGVMSGLVWGVEPTDPVTFVGVAAVLLAVSALACYLPARRATRIDPTEALKAG